MGFDYIMGVGRTPQLTQDVNINAYSAYVDDLCQGGTISYTQTQFLTVTGDYNNLINPNYTDTTAPFSISTGGSVTGTLTFIIDLKRKVGLGKHNLSITASRSASTNPFISVEVLVSDDNITYKRIYYDSETAASGSVSVGISKDTFYFGTFGRYIKIEFVKSGVSSTGGDVTFNNRIIIFPDYIQY